MLAGLEGMEGVALLQLLAEWLCDVRKVIQGVVYDVTCIRTAEE